MKNVCCGFWLLSLGLVVTDKAGLYFKEHPPPEFTPHPPVEIASACRKLRGEITVPCGRCKLWPLYGQRLQEHTPLNHFAWGDMKYFTKEVNI